MNKKRNRKIEAGLVITLLLLVTVASITIHAEEDYPYTFRIEWLKKYIEDPDQNGQRGESMDIVYDQNGDIDGFIIVGSITHGSSKQYMYIIRTDEDGNVVEKVLFEGEKYFSVFDFISAILFEISWAGSPEQRDEKMEEIQASAEEVREKIDEGDYSSFKSFDELRGIFLNSSP